MSNYKKIKRNRNIFGKNYGISAGATIIWTLLIIFFVGIGWFLYEPIYKLVTEGVPRKEPSPITDIANETDNPPLAENEPPLEENPTEPVKQKNMSCSYIPTSILLDNDALEQHLLTLNKDKINSVMIDLKDINGNILYKTQLNGYNETRIVSSDAIDLKETISKITEKGFSVVGRIYAFKDHVAPLLFGDMSIKYMDTNMIWLDNTKENGGRPWLNPYSETAQNYIIDIANEAYSLGVRDIVFDGVQFPSAGLSVANFGKISKTNSEILKDFAEKADNSANEKGGRAFIAVNSSAIFGDNKIYGGNPLDFAKYGVALNLQPSLFTNDFKLSEDVVLENPTANQGKTVEAILSALKNDLDIEKTIAILGGGTTDHLSEQAEKTAAFGIKDYIAIMP
ncbi:MAG: putative glycoside hydrolase [Oscillospiraceae bacterium]